MMEILAAVLFLLTEKTFILLNLMFFYQSLSIVVCVVLLMNSLNFLSEIRNNMFQLLVMILNSLMWRLVFHKSQFLV